MYSNLKDFSKEKTFIFLKLTQNREIKLCTQNTYSTTYIGLILGTMSCL